MKNKHNMTMNLKIIIEKISILSKKFKKLTHPMSMFIF